MSHRGPWFLSILALAVTGLALLAALLLAGYTHEGDSPFTPAGRWGQLAIALLGFGVATTALVALAARESVRLSAALALASMGIAVGWVPLMLAFVE